MSHHTESSLQSHGYHNGKFVPVTNDSLKGKCPSSFYPADFTFVCPTELGTWRQLCGVHQAGVEVYGSRPYAFRTQAWHTLRPSRKCNIHWSATNRGSRALGVLIGRKLALRALSSSTERQDQDHGSA